MRDDDEAGRSDRPDGEESGAGAAEARASSPGPVERLAAQDVYAAVRRAADPLAIMDRGGRFVFVNGALDDLLGDTVGRDLHGRRWTEILAPGEAARVERESRPSLRSGEAWRGRVRLERDPTGDAAGAPGAAPGRRPEALELSLTPLAEDRMLLMARPAGVRRDRGLEEAGEPRDPLHDPATGLPSAALFHELARRSLAAARRDGRTGAVLVVEPGLPTGTDGAPDVGVERRLLQIAARRLLRELDPADAAGLLEDRRLGVAVDRVDGEAEAVRLGRELVEALAQAVPVRGGRRPFSPSAGIAIPSASRESTEALVDLARQAAEAGRGSRRSPIRIHRPGIGSTPPYRSSLTEELRDALGRYALAVHYQPVLRLDADGPAGAQALVRWPHPRHGLLDAARFVPLARESGLVRRLDRWVLARAALDGDRAKEASTLPISVHVAPETWGDPGLAGYVGRVLEDRASPASRLLVHLEADLARTSLAELRPAVADLRAVGAGVAVEGIRADNASTSYLEGLAPEVVCVERSLAAGAADDGTRLGVLRTLTDVAHTLGARVRAEGIERASELAVVRNAGCDEARGYLIGWPAADALGLAARDA